MILTQARPMLSAMDRAKGVFYLALALVLLAFPVGAAAALLSGADLTIPALIWVVLGLMGIGGIRGIAHGLKLIKGPPSNA